MILAKPPRDKIFQLPPTGSYGPYLVYAFSLLGCLLGNSLPGQTLDAIKSEVADRAVNPLQINGTIGLTLGLYNSSNIAPRRDRYSYLFNGNINPRFFGIDCPISGNFSQLETQLLQPFNQFGISPRYKWAKAHLGYRNLTFSPLTLNGHTFLGAGMELNPTLKGTTQLRIGGMYGRLRRPVEPIDVLNSAQFPAYRRMGYALKLGVGSSKEAANYIDFILFRGYDEPESIERPLGVDPVTPEDNLVLGISGQYRLWKALTLKADWASSAFTKDRGSAAADRDLLPIQGRLGNLFTPNISTQTSSSLITELNYQLPTADIGLTYRRIAPDYVSLGSYFFQNDVEDIALQANTSLREGKIMLGGSIGFQRNNLDNQLNTRSERLIGSLSYAHRITDRININANYSNYASSLLVRQETLSDSLDLFQVSTNYGLSGNYSFGTAEVRQTLSLNLSYQHAQARDAYRVYDETTDFYNAGLIYNRQIPKRNLGFTGALNVVHSITSNVTSTIMGPGVGVNAAFMEKKLRTRYFLSYRNSVMNSAANFGVLQNRASVSYEPIPRHRITLTLAHLRKFDYVQSDRSYAEIQGQLGYQFSF